MAFSHKRAKETTKTRASSEARTKNGPSYSPLPKAFRHHGFNYRQIEREENAAVYEQTQIGGSDSNVTYEVIRIRRRSGFWIGDRFVEPAERYPKCEAWGIDGFTFNDQDAAFRKLAELRR